MRKFKQRPDGRYETTVYLGGGKYKHVYADTQKELTALVADLKMRLGKGIDLTALNDTFGEWAQRWLIKKKVSVSNGRYNVCTYRINNLAPILHIPVAKIRTADIQTIIYEMYNNGYSHCVLSEVKNTASQVLQLAIDNRVLDYNAAAAVDIPKAQPRERRRALTTEEQQWITAPSDNRGHRAAMIMMYAGLRRGELIPLMWTDIDFVNKTISISKSVEIINGKSVLKDGAKTDAGERVVYIPDILVDFLKKENRQRSMLVCPNTKGEMLSESGFRRMWESYQKELNIKYGDFTGILVPDKTGPEKMIQYKPPKSRFAPEKVPTVIDNITPHMLRHTFITLMYFAGVDILTAKEQAGHADVQTTMEIYTHLDRQFKKKQINKLNDYLNPKNSENAK